MHFTLLVNLTKKKRKKKKYFEFIFVTAILFHYSLKGRLYNCVRSLGLALPLPSRLITSVTCWQLKAISKNSATFGCWHTSVMNQTFHFIVVLLFFPTEPFPTAFPLQLPYPLQTDVPRLASTAVHQQKAVQPHTALQPQLSGPCPLQLCPCLPVSPGTQTKHSEEGLLQGNALWGSTSRQHLIASRASLIFNSVFFFQASVLLLLTIFQHLDHAVLSASLQGIDKKTSNCQLLQSHFSSFVQTQFGCQHIEIQNFFPNYLTLIWQPSGRDMVGVKPLVINHESPCLHTEPTRLKVSSYGMFRSS